MIHFFNKHVDFIFQLVNIAMLESPNTKLATVFRFLYNTPALQSVIPAWHMANYTIITQE